MQPLSYQSSETSCWIVCMLNGIRYLLKKSRVETPTYRLIHSLLRDSGIAYIQERDLEKLREVYWRLGKYTPLKFECEIGEDVTAAVKNLEFKKKSVAVCLIGDGDHAILLNQRHGKWLHAFDPWWYARPKKRQENAPQHLKFPLDDRFVNVKIQEPHFLEERVDQNEYINGRAYQMGEISLRFITIIRKD